MGVPRWIRSLPRLVDLIPYILLLAGAAAASRAHAQFTAITKNPLGDNGSAFGVSWADYDRDGDPDLYISNDGANLLLRNDGGGNFTDLTAPPLDDGGNGGSSVWGDYDNDGDPDLYLVNYASSNHLFRNDGASGFSDVTTAALADSGGPGQGAAWADFDGDGDLDLYIVHYGTPNKLLRQDATGVFVDATNGPLADPGWGLAAAWGDYDSDGDPDLYITNDGPNRLLRNDGMGHFTRITGLAIEESGPGQGAAWGDYDNDGDLDLYVANYGTSNKLLRNDGGAFTAITAGPLGDTSNSTGVAWGDYDNDGDLDLYVANYGTPNELLRNDGSGVFTAITAGPLGDSGNGTGVAWADYDLDGDLDLYLANDGQSNVLMRNDLASGAHWLELSLTGIASNRSAIGARARVVSGGVSRIREVTGGSGYMSQNDLVLHFGLGASSVADSVIIRWPSGVVESYVALAANRRYSLNELSVTAVEDASPTVAPLRLASPTPNPAFGPVALSFTLSRPSHARLSIFDITGRWVATLVDKDLPPGVHPIRWDHRDARGMRVASGIYLARLEALGETRLRKLALLR